MARIGSRSRRLGLNRKMAAASAAVCRERDTIHTILEVDVSAPRRLIREHAERSGERLSFTAYLVACLAGAVARHPELNAMVARGKLVTLDDITVGVLVEREVHGERVPESLPVPSADRMSVSDLTTMLRDAQKAQGGLGQFSGATWIRFVPSFLFRGMIRIASRSVRVARKYGVLAVTSVGMFTSGAVWLVPLSASTITLAVGGLVERPVLAEGGLVMREHVCLTVSFDHDIIDGAPAARFSDTLSRLVCSGELLKSLGEAI